MKKTFKNLWKKKPFRIAIYILLGISVVGAMFDTTDEPQSAEAEKQTIVESSKEESKPNEKEEAEKVEFVITDGKTYEDIKSELIPGTSQYKYYVPAGTYKITALEKGTTKSPITFRVDGEVVYQEQYTSSFTITLDGEASFTMPTQMQLHFEKK